MFWFCFFAILTVCTQITQRTAEMEKRFSNLGNFGVQEIQNSGELFAQPEVVNSRKLFTQPEDLMGSYTVCSDGVTTCLVLTQICRYCFCYIVPGSQIIFGTKVIGANGACIWSICECAPI